MRCLSGCLTVFNEIYRFRNDKHQAIYVILYCNNLIIYVTKHHTRLLCGRWCAHFNWLQAIISRQRHQSKTKRIIQAKKKKNCCSIDCLKKNSIIHIIELWICLNLLCVAEIYLHKMSMSKFLIRNCCRLIEMNGIGWQAVMKWCDQILCQSTEFHPLKWKQR